jgi:hypothetical protein
MRNKNDKRKRSQVKQFFDAVNRRSEKEVTELLSQGVSPDATDYYANSPLMLVTSSRQGFTLGKLLIGQEPRFMAPTSLGKPLCLMHAGQAILAP